MTTAEELPRRSLNPHAEVHRMPVDVLRRLLARLESAPDDVPPDGPTEQLEDRVAELLGTPAALFFPSGTMAQQTALRVHAERTGRSTFAAHPHCHLDRWEQRGYAAVHGLRFHSVGDRNELLTQEELAAVGEPLAAAVWELPQRDLGGLLPSWAQLCAQVETVRAGGAAAHLDGARLWEAQPYYARPLPELAGLFDSVYVSLYKGLRGIRGSVLAADEETIAHAAVWRQRLGGAIPDAWPLALAGLDGLDRHLPRMPEYRDLAVGLAAALNAEGRVYAYPDPPQTPMFHVRLPVPKTAAERASAELLADRGDLLFRTAASGADRRHCTVELVVSDTALDFTHQEVAELFGEVVERAERLVEAGELAD